MREQVPYYNEPSCAVKEPEYLDIARKMASEIVERYTPDQQNEILLEILNIVKSARTNKIQQADETLQFLRQSLDILTKQFA